MSEISVNDIGCSSIEVPKSYLVAKRILDIVVAAFAGVLFLPIVCLVALVICCVDGFPPFYRQQRVGKGGKVFWIYKIRSMRKDADQILLRNPKLLEEFEKNFKLENDPRIIPVIGNFIRATSIDELPQLFNVLRGDMSIVGPRPIVTKELESLYGDFARYYLAVKPGCAGLWQCSGRSEVAYDERVQLDVKYVQSLSIAGDIKILFLTAVAILARKGAH